MAKPVKIKIRGSDERETDAPAVDDFLGQVGDLLHILKSVEKTIADDGQNAIVWRITNVKMNSPVTVELTPFPKEVGVFIGERAARVEKATYEGLQSLERGNVTPTYFDGDAIKSARAIYSRVANGLGNTSIDFDKSISLHPLNIDKADARNVSRAFADADLLPPVPYKEIGSVEGFLSKVELDGFGRAILRFRARLNKEEVKAVATGRAFEQVGEMRLAEVWQGVRVRVYGTISYGDLGRVAGMVATGLEILDQTALPSPDDIVEEDFTGGLKAEDYLSELRNG